jgi:hypothetical protein
VNSRSDEATVAVHGLTPVSMSIPFRVFYLVPLIQVAWSDGSVSPGERDKVLEVASLHGIKAGSVAHERLQA